MIIRESWKYHLLPLFFLAGLTVSPAPSAGSPPTLSAAVRPISEIAVGASSFEAALPGGETIRVFTYRAENHGPDDPIIILLAGGGRNGADYRDSWIRAAERFRLLILAPSFDEAQFPGPINYNLAGMVREGADVATLRNVVLGRPETWLFSDIEAIFDHAVARTGSRQTHYDLFGHSAGAQIVHRMILLAPETRIRTAVAANSGWYTVPAQNVPFPYGLGGISLPADQLEKAFGRRLVLMLGERDDARETRGHLRASPEANAQGPHRFARGEYFNNLAANEAARLGLHLSWRLEMIPGVGHDYRRMGEAAARQLYGTP